MGATRRSHKMFYMAPNSIHHQQQLQTGRKFTSVLNANLIRQSRKFDMQMSPFSPSLAHQLHILQCIPFDDGRLVETTSGIWWGVCSSDRQCTHSTTQGLYCVWRHRTWNDVGRALKQQLARPRRQREDDDRYEPTFSFRQRYFQGCLKRIALLVGWLVGWPTRTIGATQTRTQLNNK